MNSRRITLATAALGAAVAGLGFAVPAAAAPSSRAADCDRAPWQARVQGYPAGFSAGAPSGDYLWHNESGFHLRVTHGTDHDRRVYSGTLHASAPLRMEPVKLEKGDVAQLSRDRRTIVFVFSNHGYVDGVNFHSDCAARLTVSRLHIGNRNLPASHVYLGHAKAHPAQVPFTVHRAAAPTT